MPNFVPTEEQWQKMKAHIKSDSYKKEDFFVFETLAVGDKIVPNRYMRLTPALLRVMEEDAKRGVSLMLNHNWSQIGVQSIPIGKVFDARIAGGTQEGEETSLYTTQYILRDDSKVDGYSKNDIIKLIESGILADISVGWGTTRESYKCNICGNSIYDYSKCKHIPGRKYIVNEDTNEVKECIVQAEPPKELHAGNNVLMENSIVFDGAYPNAIIQSSIGEEIKTSNGVFKTLSGKEELSEKDIIIGYSLGPDNINLLYKQSLEKGGLEDMEKPEANATELENEVVDTEESTETTSTVEGTETAPDVVQTQGEESETDATEEEPTEVTPTEEASTEDATAEGDANNAESTEMSVEKAILEKFGNMCDSVEELVEMAKEGLDHRNEVISEALESGVHSMGNSFNKDIFAKTFSNMKTKDIEEMGKAWETEANAKFVKEKVSKQDISDSKEEFKRISMKQFKTDNY